MKQKIPFLLMLLVLCNLLSTNCTKPNGKLDDNRISVWYGNAQTTGATGHPQGCVNILGNVENGISISEAWSLSTMGLICRKLNT